MSTGKYLIVGLGNIGLTYENTRHNIGFSIVDDIAKSHDINFETVRLGEKADFKHKGARIILFKPNTFINRSGKAVSYWVKKEKIPIQNLLILVDNLHLSFGKIRLKPKGSNAGHNGLRDIETHLGLTTYPRLYFGIGVEKKTSNQVDFVLGKWDEDEQKELLKLIEHCKKTIISFTMIGIEKTMNIYN